MRPSFQNCGVIESNFNPRIPYGMRPTECMSYGGISLFQSTHPVWDATESQGTCRYACLHFNPRIPYGMRPDSARDNSTRYYQPFQSTHPVWDATKIHGNATHPYPISIHASRMGCDPKTFNPTRSLSVFQSTHPVWDATMYLHLLMELALFQSTHPVWDATDETTFDFDLYLDFNPRIPYGMRPGGLREHHRDAFISIHASRMGCDSTIRPCRCWCRYFNPRIPYGMRQGNTATPVVNT